MKRIRLGNTIDIVWEIFLGKDKDKGKYDLTGKKLTIYLVSAFDRIKISDFTTEFNVLRFTFEGKDQKHAGRYQMTFVENEGGDDTRTLDKCDAFELVRGSCMETDDLSEITLASSFDALRIYPIIPQVGPNRNWWVDGVDTGKSSVGLTAYEFAKEQGYEGTEEEYAAECLAVPVLNEESRSATAEAIVATEASIAQQEEVSSYMKDVAEPTIERATAAALNAEQVASDIRSEADAALEEVGAAIATANQTAEKANAAATRAETEANKAERNLAQITSYMSGTVNPAVTSARNAATEATEAASKAAKDVQAAIDEIDPVLNGKADKVQFEGKSYVETDGISTNDFYYSMPDSADGTENDIIATKGNLKKINGQDLYGKGNIVIEGAHNIGSIDLFEQIIAERQNHDLTAEDKDAILSGKIITTSAGNGVVPTISSNSMGENGAVLIFHFNERLYEMFVMWSDTHCYINGVLSFTKDTKLYADSELSETSENAVQNKVVTEKLTELSERVEELEKGGQGGGASVEGDTLIFSASSSAQVIGNTLKL